MSAVPAGNTKFHRIILKGDGFRLYKAEVISFLHISDFSKRLQASLQYPVHVSNKDAVIRHRNFLIPGAAQPVLHFPFIEHAPAAVDDETVHSQLIREFCP